MDIMEEIEVIKLYNRNIKRSHSFLLNVFDLMLSSLYKIAHLLQVQKFNWFLASKNLIRFHKALLLRRITDK